MPSSYVNRRGGSEQASDDNHEANAGRLCIVGHTKEKARRETSFGSAAVEPTRLYTVR